MKGLQALTGHVLKKKIILSGIESSIKAQQLSSRADEFEGWGVNLPNGISSILQFHTLNQTSG